MLLIIQMLFIHAIPYSLTLRNEDTLYDTVLSTKQQLYCALFKLKKNSFFLLIQQLFNSCYTLHFQLREKNEPTI